MKILSSPDYNPFYSIKAAKIDKVRDSEYCLDVIENIARVEDKTLVANDAYSYLERELELENGELDEEMSQLRERATKHHQAAALATQPQEPSE